jgi:hypothetical protein
MGAVLAPSGVPGHMLRLLRLHMRCDLCEAGCAAAPPQARRRGFVLCAKAAVTLLQCRSGFVVECSLLACTDVPRLCGVETLAI